MPFNAVVRELQYHYTEREHLAQGQLLSEKLREREHLESQLAQIKTDFKGRIEAIAAAANVHAENVGSGYEYRSTECTAYFDVPRKGMKTIVRNDTGQVACEENMTPADRQMVMQWEVEEARKVEGLPEASFVQAEEQEAGNLVEFPGQHPDPEDQPEAEADPDSQEEAEEAEEAEEPAEAEADAETEEENEPVARRAQIQE
jgi:hypothetical protein